MAQRNVTLADAYSVASTTDDVMLSANTTMHRTQLRMYTHTHMAMLVTMKVQHYLHMHCTLYMKNVASKEQTTEKRSHRQSSTRYQVELATAN